MVRCGPPDMIGALIDKTRDLTVENTAQACRIAMLEAEMKALRPREQAFNAIWQDLSKEERKVLKNAWAVRGWTWGTAIPD
jgi:hypothetical protein